MGEINIRGTEREAVTAVDVDILQKLVDQCVYGEQPGALYRLGLTNCGMYVAEQLRCFERALADYGKAKAAKKRDATRAELIHAGSNLVHAVQQMKHRVETEQREGQLFYVDDQIIPPYHFRDKLTVRVSFRWRRTVEDDWAHGSITFSHTSIPHLDYALPRPTQKPSAAKLERERQDNLFREWEYLKMLSLCSVRDFFRSGGDGSTIPPNFSAKPDYRGSLNNYSADFWRKR